jgi:hypothetical protein
MRLAETSSLPASNSRLPTADSSIPVESLVPVGICSLLPKRLVSIAFGRSGLATTRYLACLFCDLTLHVRPYLGFISLKYHLIVVQLCRIVRFLVGHFVLDLFVFIHIAASNAFF